MTTETLDAPFDVEDVEQAPKETATALAIRQVTAVNADFDKVERGLLALEEKHSGVVYAVDTPKGLDEAKRARAEIREPRYAVQNAVTSAKKPLEALKKAIAARGDQILARIEPLESHVDAQIKAEEQRKEVEKAAREQAEREVAARLQNQIDAIRTMVVAAVGLNAAGIQSQIDGLALVEVTLEEFGERAGEAAQAKVQTMAKLGDMHAAAAAREAETVRLAAERIELDRMRAEQAEREQTARVAEAKRLAEERLALDAERAEMKRQSDAMAAERKAIDDAKAAEARRVEEAAAAERRKVEEAARAARAEEEAKAAAARKVEQDRIDAEAAAERNRLDDEAAARRADAERFAEQARLEHQRKGEEREAREAAEAKKRDAAPAMFAALVAAHALLCSISLIEEAERAVIDNAAAAIALASA